MNRSAPSRRVALDVRCLQDPAYARRGVGRHTLALLRHSPPGLRLEGLTDPALPPLIDEARAALWVEHPNPYAAWADPPDLFVNLSPMTHDPLYAARLMADRRIGHVAVVYDFIPRREPARYFGGAAERLRYAAGLRWLARAELFAPISRSTADDLMSLLGVPESAVAVTGAPVEAVFERANAVRAGRPPRHILVVGGGDPRKNPEVVIRAHARSAALQEKGVPLVVGGGYGPENAEAFRALARECGGRDDLVEVPGHVPEQALLETYALAYAIVCPSRDEGFSLPVVEAMAAGLPCLASDIPAQRELVGDPTLRFPPEDDGVLTPMLERAVFDDRWRTATVAAQSSVWPRFRAREVGQRFWDAVLARFGRSCATVEPGAPAVLRGARPRVALLSPLPPDRSGVADYTAASCGPLGRLVDLHVFTETAAPNPLPNVASVRPFGALPHLMPGFDRIVSVVGNSHFHLRIFEQLLRYGGACIAHDARLIAFYLALLGPERACAAASRELGRPVSESEIYTWHHEEHKTEALFLQDVAEQARPMIVHSAVTQRFVCERHGITPTYLPFSIYRPWKAEDLTPARRMAARERLGFTGHEVVIATFGFVHHTKAPEECVWALEVLRGWGVPASLHFVGNVEAMPDRGAALQALVAQLGLTTHVRFAHGDYIPEEVYRDYLIGADLAVQVRTYGLGGLSGALLDCAAAGLPTVTNEALSAAVGVPATYTRSVSDALSPLLLAEGLVDLHEMRVVGRNWEDERAAYSEARSFDAYAHKLCEALGLDLAA